MSDSIPAGRMQLPDVASKQFAAMVRLERSIELDPVVRELVKVRASQINGCAFCLDMHWKDARAAGERDERLYLSASSCSRSSRSTDGTRLMIASRAEPGHYRPAAVAAA